MIFTCNAWFISMISDNVTIPSHVSSVDCIPNCNKTWFFFNASFIINNNSSDNIFFPIFSVSNVLDNAYINIINIIQVHINT